MDLIDLGFDSSFETHVCKEDLALRRIGRVVEVQRNGALVSTPDGACWARPRGRLLAEEGAGQAAVGDFVLLSPRPVDSAGAPYSAEDGWTFIESILPRRTELTRAAVGGQGRAQVIAANLDLVLITTALDQDFSERRIERYLAAVWSSGALPAVILTKADLQPPGAVAALVARVEALAPGVPVIAVSVSTGENLDRLRVLAAPRRTLALVGSSGVGKSTLVNALLDRVEQATQAVRSDDGKGRHTTTARHLFILPSGAIIIDTPGMREFAPHDAAAGIAQVFQDIESIAARCRFSDCRHEEEPGCAVNAALADGTLDGERLKSFYKLAREQAYLDRRQDARLRAATQKKWKQVARDQRQKKKLRV